VFTELTVEDIELAVCSMVLTFELIVFDVDCIELTVEDMEFAVC
jgi:hypothetical protein